jgi:ribonuclease HII
MLFGHGAGETLRLVIAKMKTRPDLQHERRLWQAGMTAVAGLDEAGRGAWAGPVVAGAVVLAQRDDGALAGVDDSKRLSPGQRAALYDRVTAAAADWAAGAASAQEIDALGILPATRLAMARALAGLAAAPQCLLIDHLRLPGAPVAQHAITHGDSLVLSIAAASIVAKVTRDRLMVKLDGDFPGYGFARHKGYGTPEHRRMLHGLGPCPIHRTTFAPLRAGLLFPVIAPGGAPCAPYAAQ